jgi:hypothetical protein
LTIAANVLLAVVLCAAAALKLRDPRRSAAALEVFGLDARALRMAALVAVCCVELGLAAALIVGVSWAAFATAALFGVFALATLAALLAGRAGRPCACFGSASRLGWSSPVRAALLAALAVTSGERWLPAAPNSYDTGLTIALAVSLAAVAGLGVVVFALARELGVLRLSQASQGALEIEAEGPPIGAVQDWGAQLPERPAALLGLAVFSSEGCPMCRRLAPSVAYVASDPLLSVRVFDEVSDQATWAAAAVPGSPYAVALDRANVALAKGTFNNLAQLESIIATARMREAERGVVV